MVLAQISKEEKMKAKRVACLVLIALLLASCATMVRIETNIPGATVKINNEKAGSTPVVKSLSDFAFANYNVIIEKEGYETINTQLAKEVKAGTLIGGLFIWPLLLWCYGPMPYQAFELNAK